MNPEDEVNNEQQPVQVEDIRPAMTEEDRKRALEEIMRVLRGDQ